MSKSGKYKFYSGTLSSDLEISYGALTNSLATGGFISNDGSNSFTVSFKFNNTDEYKEYITINEGELLDLSSFPPFYSVKLIYNLSTSYRVLVGQFKIGTY